MTFQKSQPLHKYVYTSYVKQTCKLACVYSCINILNIVRTKMDYPSPSAKISFVTFFTLAVKNICFRFVTKAFCHPQKECAVSIQQNLFYFHSQ